LVSLLPGVAGDCWHGAGASPYRFDRGVHGGEMWVEDVGGWVGGWVENVGRAGPQGLGFTVV
jgi:hypothetical protein